jgi:hypothetical protein
VTSSPARLLTVISAATMTTKTVQCSTLVGDGSTDNADLLQSCADSNAPAAVPNQIVYLAAPAGTFRVSHGVVLHTGEILLGSGASSSEVIGDQPNSELQPLFTIPQYSGIAGLTIKAPGASLIGTSDLSGNPATSGHVFLANLVLDSTSSDLANNPATMVALSGPDILSSTTGLTTMLSRAKTPSLNPILAMQRGVLGTQAAQAALCSV